MESRLYNHGYTLPAEFLSQGGQPFKGAMTSQPWIRGAHRFYLQRLLCFNGAMALQPWIICAVRVQDERLQPASMEPWPVSHGHVDQPLFSSGTEIELQ